MKITQEKIQLTALLSAVFIIVLLIISSISCNTPLSVQVTGTCPTDTTCTVNLTVNGYLDFNSDTLTCDSIYIVSESSPFRAGALINTCTAINVRGGTPPYKYIWSTLPITTGNPVRITEPNIYCVCISDSTGQSILKLFNIK